MFEWLKGLLGGLSGRSPSAPHAERSDDSTDADADEAGNAPSEPDFDPNEPIAVEITNELDLHGFNPRETRDAINDYIDEAADRGYRTVRIAHGRGKGVQKQITQSVLSQHPRVASYRDDGSNFGATIATLRGSPDDLVG